MQIGLLTRDPESWCSQRINEALKREGATTVTINFNSFLASILPGQNRFEVVTANSRFSALDFDGIIVRPIGRGSLQEIIFRLDLLHMLEEDNVTIINPASAIEKAADKYYSLAILSKRGIPVPPTIVTERASLAAQAIGLLGSDVVVKPIFGSRGIGLTRVNDPEAGRRIFNSLSFLREVHYIQKYVHQSNSDIRVFVVGGLPIAAMRRESEDWRKNFSRGARVSALKPPEDVQELATKSSEALGCKVAGVDVMEGPDGYLVSEVNSQPGFRGLQSVTKVDIAEAIAKYTLEECKR